MPEQNARATSPKGKIDKGTIIVLGAFLLVALVGGFLAYSLSRDFFATTGLINVGDAPPIVLSQKTPAPGELPGASQNMPSVEPMMGMPTPIPWEGEGQVTILFMGLDYRDWADGNDVPRTDTMILFKIDTINKTVGMLAIPRDMWVNIPGFGYSTINTAYPLGVGSRLPGGGPGLTMKTVEHFIGVPVNYYALVDFNSFVRFIDHLGGLKMKIREEIIVDPIGPGNTTTIEPGTQTLDGSLVLAYARMRYTQDGDFDRSSRQMEIIRALRDQIVDLNMLPALITKAPMLYDQLSSGIITNLTLEQLIQLGWASVQIEKEDIKQGVFNPHTDVGYASTMLGGNNKDVLIPVPDRIRTLRDQVFVITGPFDPSSAEAAGTSAELMQAEGAQVMLRNGTNINNLSQTTGELLRGHGMNIIGEEGAGQAYGATTIIDYTGNPYTIRFLIEALNLPNARIVNRFTPDSTMDVEVMLGTDWANQQ
jgi:polyisoprenyl-teichoic acid--peptidoglycan teichoic acid transferase